MQPSQASRWITDARFAPYLAYSGGDHAVAPELYVWNARIAAAAFETLHHVEVLPRNVVDQRFAPFDPSVSATATWLTDPTILNEASRRRVAGDDRTGQARGQVPHARPGSGARRRSPNTSASLQRTPQVNYRKLPYRLGYGLRLGTSHSATRASTWSHMTEQANVVAVAINDARASPVLRERVRALAAEARASAILPADRWR